MPAHVTSTTSGFYNPRDYENPLFRRKRIKALLNYRFVPTRYRKDPLTEFEKLYNQWETTQKKVKDATHILTLESEY